MAGALQSLVARFSPTLFGAVLATALVPACDCGGERIEDPDEVYALVDDLLERGDLETAVALLEQHELAETDRGLFLRAEAAVMAAEFDTAFELLTVRMQLEPEQLYLLTDACAMGALAALDNGNAAVAAQRVQHCERHDRVDVRALAIRSSEAPPTAEQVDALLTSIRGAEPGPEVDVAAAQLELGLLEHAERLAETDDLASLELTTLAFRVGQDPEVGGRLAQAYFDAAEARFDSDPQTAATLYEHLYVARIEGLEVDPELAARAETRSRDALFPVYQGNLRARYDRKFADEDAEAGIFDPAAGTFDFGVLDDAAYEEFLVWLYRRMERPRPFPTPDSLAWAGVCEDRSRPCAFVFRDFARIAYYTGRIEEEFLAANPGVDFSYGAP